MENKELLIKYFQAHYDEQDKLRKDDEHSWDYERFNYHEGRAISYEHIVDILSDKELRESELKRFSEHYGED